MKRVLIANRGEIALRVMKTAKKMGIKTILSYIPGITNLFAITEEYDRLTFSEEKFDRIQAGLYKSKEIEKAKKLVAKIVETQKSNPRYDYASHEQIEIDKLVYEAYGLSAEDVQEVENWYARRYPKHEWR